MAVSGECNNNNERKKNKKNKKNKNKNKNKNKKKNYRLKPLTTLSEEVKTAEMSEIGSINHETRYSNS